MSIGPWPGQELNLSAWLPVRNCRRLTPIEGILIFLTWIVGDLNATSSLSGILEKINVGTLVEAMMARLNVFRAVEVVDVSKTVTAVSWMLNAPWLQRPDLQSSYVLLSWPHGHLDEGFWARGFSKESVVFELVPNDADELVDTCLRQCRKIARSGWRGGRKAPDLGSSYEIFHIMYLRSRRRQMDRSAADQLASLAIRLSRNACVALHGGFAGA